MKPICLEGPLAVRTLEYVGHLINEGLFKHAVFNQTLEGFDFSFRHLTDPDASFNVAMVITPNRLIGPGRTLTVSVAGLWRMPGEYQVEHYFIPECLIGTDELDALSQALCQNIENLRGTDFLIRRSLRVVDIEQAFQNLGASR